MSRRGCAEALGYPVPGTFRKTRPRFPGQDFDTYIQKSDNLQIWNEQVAPSRRYVLIRVDEHGVVTKVRVVPGRIIAAYDNTGTLTQKYQARSRKRVDRSVLVVAKDTTNVLARLRQGAAKTWPGFLPISQLFKELMPLVGSLISDPGVDQERNRGGVLHEAVCKCLGKPTRADRGQFPDVVEQLLEIKLQTAPTVDLGLVCPDSREPIAGYPEFRHCDVRYAVFYASPRNDRIRLDHLILTTGAEFFQYFQRFEGKITNKKLQIALPADFFQ